jgi:hypothetical protein
MVDPRWDQQLRNFGLEQPWCVQTFEYYVYFQAFNPRRVLTEKDWMLMYVRALLDTLELCNCDCGECINNLQRKYVLGWERRCKPADNAA